MLIEEGMILTDVHANNELDLITVLAKRAFEMGHLKEVNEYIAAVLRREEEFPTAFGYGVAIPHGETDAVKSSFLGFCKPSREVLWGPQKTPVSMVFMIGVPKKQKSSLHLKILAEISRHLLDSEFRDKIAKSKTTTDIYNVLSSIEKGIEVKKG